MKTREISDSILSLQKGIEKITDPIAAHITSELLNLIEILASDNKKLRSENQSIKDQLNELKGEQGKPEIKPNKPDDDDDDNFSCDKERKEAESNDETEQKEGFKLDASSLDKLKEHEIPPELLDNLYKLRKKKYASEADFLKVLEAELGLEAITKYGSLFVKHARYKKRKRKAKIPKIVIDRVEKCVVNVEELPEDAVSKGIKPKVVQDIIIQSDNVLFEREVYWSKSEKKTYLGKLPVGYEGDFGPNINSQIISFKYVNNMSIPKIKEFYANFRVKISGSYISNRLTKCLSIFHKEKSELYEASLEVSSFQQIDDTGSRINGKNAYTHIVCNDFCTVFFTTEKKDRLTIIDILRNFGSRVFVFNEEAFELLKQLRVSQITICKLRDLTQPGKKLHEEDIEQILSTIFPDPGKGKNTRARICEASAIAAYHEELGFPIVRVLISDDAPQFKLITDAHMLCRIHDGRHYKKLSPLVRKHQDQLKEFRKSYWEYYRKLYEYKQNPSSESAQYLSEEFDSLFSIKTGYLQLDDRIAKTLAKKESLLTVLKYPEIPLHNNQSENGARVQKRREDVSLQTKTDEGTKAKDTMMSVVETCKKLGLSSFTFIHDRVSQKFNLPSLAKLLKMRAKAKVIPC